MAKQEGGYKKSSARVGIESLLEVHPLEIGDGYSFLPLTDVTETEDSFIIEIEVPGIKKEDLVIEVTENYIYVNGKKKKDFSENIKNIRFQCMGRIFGSFQRIFEIPSPFNMHEVQAKLENGLLSIRLPKLVDKRKKKVVIEIE